MEYRPFVFGNPNNDVKVVAVNCRNGVYNF
jgi:hypothetical protein